jgi:hypothetical protein
VNLIHTIMKIIVLKHFRKVILVFSVMFCLGVSKFTFAQVPAEERTAPPMETLPQEQNQLAISYEDEIKKDELPEEAAVSLNETYPGFEITEIFRGSDGSFKVRLKKDQEKIAAFYDAGGDFIRVEDDVEEETINDDWR